jgi:hypothetical protein
MKQVNRTRLSLRELSLIIINQMHAGKSQQEMVAYLRQRGWPDVSAQHFIANVLAQNTAVAQADVHLNDPKPAEEYSGSNSALFLWLIALSGLALIGLSLISRLTA